jgi:hypothetical protein
LIVGIDLKENIVQTINNRKFNNLDEIITVSFMIWYPAPWAGCCGDGRVESR